MEDVNLTFLLYIEDTREILEVKQLIEAALKISLHPEVADSPREEPAFEAEALGLYMTLRGASTVAGRTVYRFAGATLSRYFAQGGVRTSMDSHVMRVLETAAFSRVMSRAEFAKLDVGS